MLGNVFIALSEVLKQQNIRSNKIFNNIVIFFLMTHRFNAIPQL